LISFTCNICGEHNEVEHLPSEPASCGCGSNSRIRALIHLLSMELFGESIELSRFPKLRTIRGLGISDHAGYAAVLAEKFDYTNTQYDREPRFDLTVTHPQLYGTYDFILAADVVEHIAPPIEAAFKEVCQLLRPSGFFGVTVFCNPQDQMREHFPELHEFRTVQLGEQTVLLNRRRDGTLELREDLIFHGGTGSTLEMREFGISQLERKLVDAGFREVHFLREEIAANGVVIDHDLSQPLIARKEPFHMSPAQRHELVNEWRRADSELQTQRERAERLAQEISFASQTRWVRLGRKIGLGPKFSS
jgi:SAM-dependent methyltransferase